MGGLSSLNKGKAAEREVIQLLRPVLERVFTKYPHFGEVPRLQRNTLQSDAGGYDIIGVDWMALEVKRQETLNVNAWWKQTVDQIEYGQMPVLFYRQSRKPWSVVTLGYLPLGQSQYQCRIEISAQTFLAYFEHRLIREMNAKTELLQSFKEI